jgi:hypothetical protein
VFFTGRDRIHKFYIEQDSPAASVVTGRDRIHKFYIEQDSPAASVVIGTIPDNVFTWSSKQLLPVLYTGRYRIKGKYRVGYYYC